MEFIEQNGCLVALAEGSERVGDAQAALDLIANASYAGCVGVIVGRERFREAFFDLRTGLAGEILQKFSNYRMRLAIVGDFGGHPSRALRDFIRECNRGRQVFFAPDQAAALAALCGSGRGEGEEDRGGNDDDRADAPV